MMEDLYTGKTTIRQIRRSLMQADRGFEVSEMYEGLRKAGDPGIVEGRNYVLLPSSTFCRYIMDKYGGLFHHNNLYVELRALFQPYCSRFPLTMIIND